MKELRFCDIRHDWYYSNQLLPRLLRNSIHRTQQIEFAGFPRQWIPVFEYYGIPWRLCSEPSEYMPIVSELSDQQLARYSKAAKAKGTLRTLVESISVLDPLIADLLYIVDHSIDVSKFGRAPTESNRAKLIRLTSWQSYGRPEVLRFETAVDRVGKSNSVAVLLPCSRQRPYRASRTHKKIWQALTELGYERDAVDQVVVTSLGVVPESLWNHPVVMAYDAGVPDIYRVLRLARRFFGRNIYPHVIDCLQFAPYSDILKILQHEKIVKRLTRGPVSRSRQFYLKG